MTRREGSHPPPHSAAALLGLRSVESLMLTGALASNGLLRSRLLAISRMAGDTSGPMSLMQVS
jgi:hypothetical protein